VKQVKAKRANSEQEMLKEFIKIAKKHGYKPISGQGNDNRIELEENYFQFGDLRVDTQSSHVVIEVETAGGVTNLVKYWYCLHTKNSTISKSKKTIVLLHIFNTSSEGDYGSHQLLWDFLWSQMKKDLEDRMQAERFKVRGTETNELHDALTYFEKALEK